MISKRQAQFFKKTLVSNFGRLELPYKLNFSVTNKCNSKCKICNIWKTNTENELTLDEINRIFKKANFLSWIGLTGGEPFLRNDLVEIVDIISRHCKNLFVLTMSTNGLLPNVIRRKVEEMLHLEIPWYIITVSLDGPKNVHDQIRGVKDGWEKAIKTYKELKKINSGDKRLDVSFQYTISPYNIGMFEETFTSVKKMIRDLKPEDFCITFFQVSYRYYNLDQIKKLEEFKKRLPQEINQIHKFKNQNFPGLAGLLPKTYLKFVKEFIEKDRVSLKCKALFSSCFLDATANLYPCTMFDKKLGNLRDMDYSIKNIWNTRITNEVRKDIEDYKCPRCWIQCEANQTILGNLLKSVSKII